MSNKDENLVDFDGITTLDIEPDKVLKGGIKAKMKVAILIGVLENDDLYFASSLGDTTKVLWLLEIAKKDLLDY